MRIADKLRQLNDDVFLGNKSLEQAVLEMSPDNPEGVWAETLPKLEEILNSSDFESLDQEDQDDIKEMVTSILAFNPKSLRQGKAESSFLAEILEASGWGDAQNVARLYDSVTKHGDTFVPVFDYSKDGQTAELRAEPRITFDESRLANSEYTKLKMTGFDSGVAEDIYIKMKKNEDDLGNITYSAVLPSGLVEVRDGNLLFNGKSVDNGLIKTNEASYQEAETYRQQLTRGVQGMVGANVDQATQEWINERVKNRNYKPLPEGVAGPVISSLGSDLKAFKESPDFKRARFDQWARVVDEKYNKPSKPYSKPEAGFVGPVPAVNPPPAPTPQTTPAQRAPSQVTPLDEAIGQATQGFQKFRQYFKSLR